MKGIRFWISQCSWFVDAHDHRTVQGPMEIRQIFKHFVDVDDHPLLQNV